jgi:hypothetical protein
LEKVGAEADGLNDVAREVLRAEIR